MTLVTDKEITDYGNNQLLQLLHSFRPKQKQILVVKPKKEVVAKERPSNSEQSTNIVNTKERQGKKVKPLKRSLENLASNPETSNITDADEIRKNIDDTKKGDNTRELLRQYEENMSNSKTESGSTRAPKPKTHSAFAVPTNDANNHIPDKNLDNSKDKLPSTTNIEQTESKPTNNDENYKGPNYFHQNDKPKKVIIKKTNSEKSESSDVEETNGFFHSILREKKSDQPLKKKKSLDTSKIKKKNDQIYQMIEESVENAEWLRRTSEFALGTARDLKRMKVKQLDVKDLDTGEILTFPFDSIQFHVLNSLVIDHNLCMIYIYRNGLRLNMAPEAFYNKVGRDYLRQNGFSFVYKSFNTNDFIDSIKPMVAASYHSGSEILFQFKYLPVIKPKK